MTSAGEQAVNLIAALAAGGLAGVERGWTLREAEPGSRVAGVRTFTLIGLAGGIAGLEATGASLVAAAIAAATAAIIVVGYWRTARERPDATSAVTAILVLGIGFLAGTGSIAPALGAAALTVLILALRESIHGFVARMDAEDVRALARFAVIALAVRPFLPDRAVGPYNAWNPAQLWLVVVIVTGFSFAGYVADRLFGARHGTIATALIGGAYSSTAVTQSLAQRVRQNGRDPTAIAGIALANAVMYGRVLVLTGVLALRILPPLALLIAPALIVQTGAGLWLLRHRDGDGTTAAPGNPIALLPAIGFMVIVGVAAVAARWAETTFGDRGIAMLLFLMGTMDVDASIVTAGGLSPDTIAATLAAFALAGTVIANMSLKIVVVFAYAGKAGTTAAWTMIASTLVLIATMIAVWTTGILS